MALSAASYQQKLNVFSIIFAVYWLLIVPFTIYQLKLFWTSRANPVIKKRKPMINMMYIIALLSSTAIIRPVLLSISIIGYDTEQIREIATTMRITFLLIPATLFSFRTFIIMFDFNYNLAVFRKRCLAAVLSPDFEYQNRWLSRKTTLGSSRYMAPYVTAWLVVFACAGFTLCILYPHWCQLFIFINFGLILIGYAFMSKYIASHRDQFDIRREILYTALIWIVLVSVYALFLYLPDDWIRIHAEDRDLVLSVVETLCVAVLMFLSTWWVNRKSVCHQKVKEGEFGRLKLTTQQSNQALSMNKTLSHFQGYSLFFEYLLEEISIENLLFVSEIVHLKHLFHKLQRKKKRINAKNRRKKRAFTVTTRPKHSNAAPFRPRSASQEHTKPDPNRFVLHVYTPHFTEDEASDYESEFEEDDQATPHTPVTPQGRSSTDPPSTLMPSSRKGTGSEAKSEESISGVASFHDTDSTKPMPMDMAQFRAIERPKHSDWKDVKNKLALNPQDENLPLISKSIYKSQIMLENDFSMKIKSIFEKYVIHSGKYEINIKYTQRRQLLAIYKEKYENYVSRSKQLNSPSSVDPASASPSTPGSAVLTVASSNKEKERKKAPSTPTEPLKLSNEEYVSLNFDVSIEDIQIFDKASQSIMGLLRNSYIEFCKTKEYSAFAEAYASEAKLDLFTALRGEAEICLCCRCGFGALF